MNSHFQSIDTTWTFSGLMVLAEARGWAGSSWCEPIQITPPRNMITRVGMAQTTSSRRPEKFHSGRYRALVLEARNHQAKATVAIIVGMTMASMITRASRVIRASALLTGPLASNTS